MKKCSSPFGIGCGLEIVPVTEIRINSSHSLCTTCAGIACHKYKVKSKELKDLEWAIDTVRKARAKANLTGEIPLERIHDALAFLDRESKKPFQVPKL